MDSQKVLTPKGVFENYGISPEKVYQLIAAGKLAAVNVSLGRRPTWLLTTAAVEAFLAGSSPTVDQDTPNATTRRRRLDEGCKRWV